jgi:hypothetical protein
MSKEELATKQTEAIAIPGLEGMITSERPAGKDTGTLGNEGIGRDDMLMPRIELAQKMSPEIDPTNVERRIPGLEFTDMYHSLSKKNLGKGPRYFSILRRDDPRWIEFNPIDEGGGIKDRNVPFGDPRTEYGPNGEKPLATMFYDFIVLLLDDFDFSNPLENVIALSFKSSGIKAAKHLNFLVQQRGPKLICKGVYALTTGSATDKKTQGVYATYKITNAGWLKEGSMIEQLAVEMFESWKDRAIEVAREPGDDDFVPADLEAKTEM